ncbi:MAG: phosphate ABC transporter permease subunit PstC [Nitriliruptoraceae bacterium]
MSSTLDPAAPSVGATARQPLGAARPDYLGTAVKGVLFACAAVSVAATLAIVASLLPPTVSFFRQIPIREFFTGTLWAPGFANASFGVWPIVVGSGMVVVISLSVAIPVGLASAVYLSEYAPPRVRQVIKPLLEVLEGIPTVAIGLFAFLFLRPLAETVLPFLPWQGPFSIGVAAVAVGLLIIPLVASVSDDAMRGVPRSLREGAYALGASKFNVTVRVVLPAAISGIVAAIVLAASRGVGETMVVLLAAGAGRPQLSFDPTKGVQTITAYIAGTATGDIPTGTLTYDTIFAVGALLFAATFVLNMIAVRFVRRYREVYD